MRGKQSPPKVSVPRGNADKPWLRWNDYGIGLFLQGDLRGAARVWTRVAELAPDKPDGPPGVTDEELKFVMDINLTEALLCTRAVGAWT